MSFRLRSRNWNQPEPALEIHRAIPSKVSIRELAETKIKDTSYQVSKFIGNELIKNTQPTTTSLNSLTENKKLSITELARLMEEDRILTTDKYVTQPVEPVIESKPETEPVIESKPETEPVIESKPETEPVIESKPETEPVIESVIEHKQEIEVVQPNKHIENIVESKPETEPMDEINFSNVTTNLPTRFLQKKLSLINCKYRLRTNFTSCAIFPFLPKDTLTSITVCCKLTNNCTFKLINKNTNSILAEVEKESGTNIFVIDEFSNIPTVLTPLELQCKVTDPNYNINNFSEVFAVQIEYN
jgi:hypothetical protein